MVHFMTLENMIEGDVPMENKENKEVRNLIMEIEHSKDCVKPEIKIVYETANVPEQKKKAAGVSASYENKRKKMIAGCTCGAKAEVDVTGNSNEKNIALQQPSYSIEDPTNPLYGNSESIAETYY